MYDAPGGEILIIWQPTTTKILLKKKTCSRTGYIILLPSFNVSITGERFPVNIGENKRKIKLLEMPKKKKTLLWFKSCGCLFSTKDTGKQSGVDKVGTLATFG